MQEYKPLTHLPVEFQQNWQAALEKSESTTGGKFALVAIRRSDGGFEDQRITVNVVDINGFPVPNVKVAFAFDTANHYVIDEDFQWSPPSPRQAFVARTNGGGQADMVLGAAGVVKEGRPGGVTVYVLEPEYSSDVVSGLGMLADHSGVVLTFQLRTDELSIGERLAAIEARLILLEE